MRYYLLLHVCYTVKKLTTAELTRRQHRHDEAVWRTVDHATSVRIDVYPPLTADYQARWRDGGISGHENCQTHATDPESEIEC